MKIQSQTNKRTSNYDIMKRQMQKEFLKYDQEKMIRKFGLASDEEYIFIRFTAMDYRIGRKNGAVSGSDDGFRTFREADYNEAMTLYDVLCYSRDNCRLSGEFVNMQSLSSVMGGSAPVGSSLFSNRLSRFDHKEVPLAKACKDLGGEKEERGDVAYRIPLFDFLPVIFRFWNSDEEFPPSLQFFTDKNILDYMHYETVWFAMSHLLERIEGKLLDCKPG